MLPLLLRITSGVTGVSVEEIKSKSRVHHKVEARFISAYVMRESGMTYSEIGRALKRDHSSALHACRTIQVAIDNPDHLGSKEIIEKVGLVLKVKDEVIAKHGVVAARSISAW
jgi:chromosomal replication initiation ATPase DnaA